MVRCRLLTVSLICCTLYLFQLPVEFRNLVVTRRHRIQWGTYLQGLCWDDNRIYCLEWRWEEDGRSLWLAVYDIRGADDGSLSLLDKVKVGGVSLSCSPRVDSSHRVFVPCREAGVRVFHFHDDRLLPARDPLMCVCSARSICVNTADTVFVSDWDTKSVCLVSVSSDTVIRRLERPAQVRGDPEHVSVVGHKVLVCFGENTLVAYRSDRPTAGQIIQAPEGLEKVYSITSDSHSSSFLVTALHSVFVFNDKLLWHRIYVSKALLQDCTVVQSQLRLGCFKGYIDFLSSQ